MYTILLLILSAFCALGSAIMLGMIPAQYAYRAWGEIATSVGVGGTLGAAAFLSAVTAFTL